MLLRRAEQASNVKSVRNISLFKRPTFCLVLCHLAFLLGCQEKKRVLLAFQKLSVALHLSVSVTLVLGEHSKEGRSCRCYRRILWPSAKAASDCSVGFIEVFIYVISEDERTGSNKISNNSWDNVLGSQITVYLLWIWQSSRYCLRISGLSWLCRI